MSSTVTVAPSFRMFSTRLIAVPRGMHTTAFLPSSRAAHATPRPWFPSVAVKNTGSAKGLDSIAFAIAYEPPSTLNAFSPKRSDSSLTQSLPMPSRAAIFESSRSGVGAYCEKPR